MSDEPTLPGNDEAEAETAPARSKATTKADLQSENDQLRERLAAAEARNDDLARAHDNRDMTEEALAKMTGQRRAATSAPHEHGHDSRSSRKPMGQVKRLDADKYVEAYPEKKLMWVNDVDGQVQRWVDAGAEPVPVKIPGERQAREVKEFAGITDRHDSEWVRAIGGPDGQGGTLYVYLLMIEPEVYDELVTYPERERQHNIRRRIMGGTDQSDDSTGPKLPSYAPNLPTGGTGFDESRDAGV